MNLSNYFMITTITTVLLLNTREIVNFTLPIEFSSKSIVVEKAHGGPRTVIQAMVDIVVTQPTATNLYITMIDEEGTVILDQVTQCLEHHISVAGLESGAYTIKTIDDNDDLQVFTITI